MSDFAQEISFILLQREFGMEDNAQGQLCGGMSIGKHLWCL